MVRQNSNHIRQKRSLGQVFLRIGAPISRILKFLRLSAGESVLEIGGGDGRVSRILAERDRRLIIVEIDERYVQLLNDRFSGHSKVSVIQGDILAPETLEKITSEAAADRLVVYGSIPYYITTPIVRWILAQPALIDRAVLLMQKEVARRLVADHGSKQYGFISVICSLSARIETGPVIGRRSFTPVPKVDSQLLSITPLEEPDLPKSGEFINMLSTLFQHRRKQIGTTLKSLYGEQFSTAVRTSAVDSGFDLTKRPEQLTPENFVELYDFLRSLVGK
jgi:16S rRNA (adenine1518-N6/adenine1519-N6)-dimethyltransferase